MKNETTVVYVVRHGESEGNRRDAFVGHTDVELTDIGRAQARNVAAYFENITIDAIYSSDLKRAHETAEYTAQTKGLSVMDDPRLREIQAGEWENRTFTELANAYPREYDLWLHDIGRSACVGGESVAALQNRVQRAVQELVCQNPGKTIAIFCHGTPIRALKAAWDGVGTEGMKEIPWASNASVTKAEYSNGIFTVLDYSIDGFHGELVTKLPENV